MDITKLPGYKSDMTPEQKLALIEAYEESHEGYVPKALLDKAASEAAENKRKLREKMTEDEQKAAKDAEERTALQENYNKLLRETTVAKHTATFVSLGYDAALAAETAEAMADGKTDVVFANQKKAFEAREKALKAELLKQTPTPPAGSGSDTEITKEQFAKMGYGERVKLHTEKPDLYKKLTGGN